MVKFYKADTRAYSPKRGTSKSAGIDLRALDAITIAPNSDSIINTGIIINIPPGYCGLLTSRSSLAKKGLLVLNQPGIIDEDYVDPLQVLVRNVGLSPVTINQAERFCQLTLVKVHPYTDPIELDEKPISKTRQGGWGSTGK
jgi:dUTP pyrophosphatase